MTAPLAEDWQPNFGNTGSPSTKMGSPSSARWAAHVAEHGLPIYEDGQPVFGNIGCISSKMCWLCYRRWAALRIDRTFVVLIPIGPLCRDPSNTISCFFVNLGHCRIRHEIIAFDSVTWRWRTGAKNWTSCLLFRQLQAYELFLTAEKNF